MAVIVNFFTPKGPSSHAPGMKSARIREDLALDGTSTAETEDGEAIFVANNESSMVAVAVGTDPDADATAETSLTSAGIPVPAGQTMAIFPRTGSKINAKAL